MNEEYEFDFDEILNGFRSGKRLTGKGGLLAPLIKQLTEAALEAEIESHIADDVLSGRKNRRNGVNKNGSFELETPRDRNGTFEPQIVKKHQTTLSNEIEEQWYVVITITHFLLLFATPYTAGCDTPNTLAIIC